jgi:hypothetical protein
MDLDLFIAEVTRLLHTDAESDLICTNAERVNLGRILNVVVAERNRGNSPIDVAAACEMVNAISWNELEALEKRVYPPKSPLEHAIFSGLFYVDHFADTVLNEQYDRTKKAT